MDSKGLLLENSPTQLDDFFSHIDLHDVQAKKNNTLLGVRMIRGNPLVYVARQGGPYQIPT